MNFWKKMTCVLTASVCVLSMAACGGTKEADTIDEQMQTTLTTTAQGLTEAVVGFSDEELEQYKETGDEFTDGAIEAWTGAKEELGKSIEYGDPVVTKDGIEYEVVIPGKFEKSDAEFIYIFDKKGVPTSMSVNVNYSMAENMKRAGLNTLMGIGIVFVMLVFLSFLISLFRFIPDPEKQKKEAAKAQAPAPVPVAEPVEEPADDTELVAVIAAAIAAAEGTSPDGFVVRSIRKANRRKW